MQYSHTLFSQFFLCPLKGKLYTCCVYIHETHVQIVWTQIVNNVISPSTEWSLNDTIKHPVQNKLSDGSWTVVDTVVFRRWFIAVAGDGQEFILTDWKGDNKQYSQRLEDKGLERLLIWQSARLVSTRAWIQSPNLCENVRHSGMLSSSQCLLQLGEFQARETLWNKKVDRKVDST